MQATRLLAQDEPAPVVTYRPGGASPFFIACDHAGRRIPARLGHARPAGPRAATAYRLGYRCLGGIAAAGRCARCVRHRADLFAPGDRLQPRCPACPAPSPSSARRPRFPAIVGLSDDERAVRAEEIFRPYQDRHRARRSTRARPRPTVLIAMHSFTPVFKGVARPWHAGVLFNRDARLARIMLDLLRAGARSVRRRERALRRLRPHRLHRAGAWREARPAASGTGNPPGPDRRPRPGSGTGPICWPACCRRRIAACLSRRPPPHDPSDHARRAGRPRPHDAAVHRRAELLRGSQRRRVQGPDTEPSSRTGSAGSSTRWKAMSCPTCSVCRPAAARPASR